MASFFGCVPTSLLLALHPWARSKESLTSLRQKTPKRTISITNFDVYGKVSEELTLKVMIKTAWPVIPTCKKRAGDEVLSGGKSHLILLASAQHEMVIGHPGAILQYDLLPRTIDGDHDACGMT